MPVQVSQSVTVPVIRIDSGIASVISPPIRVCTRSHGSNGCPYSLTHAT